MCAAIRSVWFRITIWFVATILLGSITNGKFGTTLADEQNRYPKKVAVFLSMEIKPYLQAAEALTRRLDEVGQYRIKQIIFDASETQDLETFREQIANGEYDIVVTVGTQTSRFIADCRAESNVPVVYTMLINTEDIFKNEDNVVGVSLNIPVELQLQEIKKTIPNAKTIGVLFNPKYNTRFVSEAETLGMKMGLNVEAIEVNDKTSIPKALSVNWYRMEAIWLIPDWTVTSSESINQYIIKEALLRKVPVIGYNRSFYNYGAAIALILDYEKIGVQTAEIVIDRLEKGISRELSPAFETAVNRRVLRQMGIVPGEHSEREPEWP